MSFESNPMKDLRGYIPQNKIKQLLSKANTKRDYILFRLLWVTGARISEIVGDNSWYRPDDKPRIFYGLRTKDILFDEDALILDTLKRKQYPPPKRRVSIDKKTMKLLKEYVISNNIDLDSPVFSIGRRQAFNIIRSMGKAAGIEIVGDKGIHPHHLRHSNCVAFILKNNTLEGLRKLQRKLGHANINTTAHYLQFAPEEQETVEDVFGQW